MYSRTHASRAMTRNLSVVGYFPSSSHEELHVSLDSITSKTFVRATRPVFLSVRRATAVLQKDKYTTAAVNVPYDNRWVVFIT